MPFYWTDSDIYWYHHRKEEVLQDEQSKFFRRDRLLAYLYPSSVNKEVYVTVQSVDSKE